MTKHFNEKAVNEYRRWYKTDIKAVAWAMKQEAVRTINELGRNAYNVFSIIRIMNIEWTDIVKGSCMRKNDGILDLNEKDGAKQWKAYMTEILNEENEWDQIADADTVQNPIEWVMGEEKIEAF